MISAVDTSILLDILIPDTRHMEQSLQALDEGSRAGALILSEPVYAELAAHFPDAADLERFIADTGLRLHPSGAYVLWLAGRAWRRYRDRRPRGIMCPRCGGVQQVNCAGCGEPIPVRQHIVTDFLVGAHAAVHAGRLLTRDRGFYRTYYAGLVLWSGD
jgi:predicted nucleic acid-binding protein